MKKKLSTREIVLLVILSVIVIGLVYSKFIYQPINAKISACESDKNAEQAKVDQYSIKVAKMEQMQSAVDATKGSGQGNPIPSYNNSTELLKELHDILSTTKNYALSFESVRRTDGSYIVDRPVSMSFSVHNYTEARSVLDAIEGSQYVNQISDLTIQFPTYTDGANVWNVFNYSGSWEDWDSVNVTLNVTFYELLN